MTGVLIDRCQACGGGDLEAFYQVDSIPTQTTVLLDTAHAAAAHPMGSIVLTVCGTCGFIQNTGFDSSLVDYSKPTEESQAFSPEFQHFAGELASTLVARHELTGRRVLEVGCGKGDFLHLLAERGIDEGVGIDPGYLPNRKVDGARLHFIKDWYGPEDLELTGDLVLTRHLLEHVPNVYEFTGWLLSSTKKTAGAALFTEVPDARRVLRDGAFWDVYYEHCSYFTLGSLGRMLRRVGLNVNDLGTGFGDQYLLADGTPGAMDRPHPAEEPVDELAADVAGFAVQASKRVEEWRGRVVDVLERGDSVAVWGGGSKAVAFIAALGVDHTDVSVVDINPHKQGKFLPGSAIEVEAPAVLVDKHPQLVIPMNAMYEAEIRGDLAAMGLDPVVDPL